MLHLFQYFLQSAVIQQSSSSSSSSVSDESSSSSGSSLSSQSDGVMDYPTSKTISVPSSMSVSISVSNPGFAGKTISNASLSKAEVTSP